MKEKTTDKYLTIQSVSETLGCTDKYVYILIQEGNLKAIKLGERALRVSEQSLQNFIATRSVKPEDYFAPKDPPAKKTEPGNLKVARSKWIDQ